MTRARGVTGYRMPPEVNGPMGDRYLLLVRKDGEMRMVHSEGVAYVVSDEKPWTWTDYADVEKFAPEDLTRMRPFCEPVDLADWVRVFGARLESNFHQIHRWAIQ